MVTVTKEGSKVAFTTLSIHTKHQPAAPVNISHSFPINYSSIHPTQYLKQCSRYSFSWTGPSDLDKVAKEIFMYCFFRADAVTPLDCYRMVKVKSVSKLNSLSSGLTEK